MLTNSSWQLLLSLLVISAYSLPEWNIDTQGSDIAFSEQLPESGIINTATPAPATPDASKEFADIPVWGNAVSSGELVAQGNNDCATDTRRIPRKMRARDEKICPMDSLQFKTGEENGRQPPQTSPNAQQGEHGQNNGGIGEPKRHLLFPPKDDAKSYLFIPDENRPKRNSDICPEPMHPVPVCGRPSDAYALIYPDIAGLTIEPCYTYMPFLGCVPNTIGYCCLTADVAYASDDLTQSERDLWTNLLSTSNRLVMINKGLTAGLRNLYKLVGLGCIPMEPTGKPGQGFDMSPF